MKRCLVSIVMLMALALHMQGQVIHKIDILPVNATDADSLPVISDFSFQGNCSYDMVRYMMELKGNSLRIFPFFCGYGDTTHYHGISTFALASRPAGDYLMQIVYREGSISPASGFDALTAQFDTTFAVTANSPLPATDSKTVFSMTSDAARQIIGVQILQTELLMHGRFIAENVSGQKIMDQSLSEASAFIHTAGWRSGVNVVATATVTNNTFSRKFMLS